MHHLCPPSRRKRPFTGAPGACQDLVRFFALLRIKPHAPPLVRVPVCFELNHMLHRLCGSPSIPLSFILANVLPRWNTYCVCCGTDALRAPTPSIHRLPRGLPGYLILFAPHAFEPQRQLLSSKPPSPPVFFLISTHFTATPGIPLTPPALQPRSFKSMPPVEPGGFTSDLRGRLRSLYTQ